jgi:hypothetical protein
VQPLQKLQNLDYFNNKNTGEWPELLPFLFKCVKSESEFHREAALQLFGDLAADLAAQLKPHFAILKDVLVSGLLWDPSIKV